jgi:hypothetical protein
MLRKTCCGDLSRDRVSQRSVEGEFCFLASIPNACRTIS